MRGGALKEAAHARGRSIVVTYVSKASMMDRSVSLLRQQWITVPTEDEDDRVYRPSRNDALSILKSLRSFKFSAH